MNHAVDQFDRARSRITHDLRTMIADSEDLLNAVGSVSGEGFSAARTAFEEKLRAAKTRLAEASQPILDRTRETAAVADNYVHGNPWSTAGIAIAAGVLIGLLVARR